MAKRRMFSPDITGTDIFTDMRLSAQALYFHLGLHADDDGFVGSPKQTARGIGASIKDIDTLIDNGFVIPFDDGVVVITHWRAQNSIRADRYTPTVYQNYYKLLEITEGNVYTATSRQPNGNHPQPQIVSKSDKEDKQSDNTKQYRDDFEAAWKEYPRQEGKQTGLKYYSKSRRGGATAQEILDGVKRYSVLVKHEKRDRQYIKAGGNFFKEELWKEPHTIRHNPAIADDSDILGGLL